MWVRRGAGVVGWGVLVAGAACYGNVTLGGNLGDGGSTGSSSGAGSGRGTTVAETSGPGTSASTGSSTGSASSGASRSPSAGSESSAGSASSSGTGSSTPGVTYVDAGYYRGDGSYFVDGGAYPDAGTPGDASGHLGADGSEAIDASPGCQPLAACCASLSSASQSLCDAVASSGNATNCAAELTQLQAVGDCMGVSVLASGVQLPPTQLVSDGSTLFWTTNGTPGLLAMPVGGGAVTVLLSGPVGIQSPSRFGPIYLVAVDGLNVYVTEGSSLIRIPKNGAPATLVNESGATILAATTLGATAYWLEITQQLMGGEELAVKSTLLQGGPVSTVTTFNSSGNPTYLAVTNQTVFFGYQVQSLLDFPVTGVAAGGPQSLEAGFGCEFLTSDTEAIYCSQQTGSNLRIASDGTATALGDAIDSSTMVFDDTNVYWVDQTTVGTSLKAPKGGGGTAAVIANDTSPTAIAVDSKAIYWGDQDGYIKSVPK